MRIDLSTLTDDELSQLQLDTATEVGLRQERRADVHAAKELAQKAAEAASEAPPVPIEQVSELFAPEMVVITNLGSFRNISGGFLPLTATPQAFPLGWGKVQA